MILKIILSFVCCFALCAGSVHLVETDIDDNCYIDNTTCDYDTLVKALTCNRTNFYLLQTTFFPPQTGNPLYVTVTYNFPNGSSIDYIWSTAALYFTVHPHILSYLSLYFSYIEDNRIVKLQLELPEQCSELVNNTKSDNSNYLFILTHRLHFYIQVTTEYEDLEATVVAAQNQKKEYQTKLVDIFFSMVLVLPVLILIFMWVSIRGAIPYLRCYINNSENYSSIASIYWIGQTFVIFVCGMDITSLCKSKDLVQNERLEPYQMHILITIIVIEVVGLLLNLTLLLVPVSSHNKSTKWKGNFEKVYKCLIKYILFCGIISFRGVDRKEARVWIVLSGLITPIIAMTSHIGFVVGGWVSYEDRSVAVILLYLFSFVFLYWTFQYMYLSLSTAITYIRRKKLNISCPCKKNDSRTTVIKARKTGNTNKRRASKEYQGLVEETIEASERDPLIARRRANININGDNETGVSESNHENPNVRNGKDDKKRKNEAINKMNGDTALQTQETYHYERQLYTTTLLTNLFGFDTVALFIMCVPMFFVYGFIFYIGSGLIYPLLSTIDEAMVHIYRLGSFVFVIVAFLFTYKVLTANGDGGGAIRFISNDALKYWKFLERKKEPETSATILRQAMERLQLALNAIPKSETARFNRLLKKKNFEMDKVQEHLEEALFPFNDRDKPVTHSGVKLPIGREAVAGIVTVTESMSNCFKDDRIIIDTCTERVKSWIALIREEEKQERIEKRIKQDKKITAIYDKAIKEFTAGVNLFRSMLVRVLGVPPMYYNKDKANALVGALMYERVNSLCRANEYGQHDADEEENGGEGGEQPGAAADIEQEDEDNPTVVQQNDPWKNNRYALLLSLIEEEF